VHRSRPWIAPQGRFDPPLLDWFQMIMAHSHYDRFPSLPETQWYRDAGIRRVLLAAMRLQPGMTVLDIGCGGGALIRDLAAAGHRAVGVDCSRVMVELAQRHARGLADANLIYGRYEDQVDALGRFDRVVCKNVLHLVSDVRAFLENIHRNLLPSGFLVVIETVSPTMEANQFVRALFGAAKLTDIKSHFFVRSTFSRILESAGFDIQTECLHSQTLDLEEWLRAKRVRLSDSLAASALVAGASPAVKTAMEIRSVDTDGAKSWTLRRLQFVSTIRSREQLHPCPDLTSDIVALRNPLLVGAAAH
jgi:2-polyprenyl-3-methyl-5-hydroxy-6-metoxy-1,4-benzoquinol methylase